MLIYVILCHEEKSTNRSREFSHGRDKLHRKFTFSIVDTVNLEHFIHIDSVDSEKK